MATERSQPPQSTNLGTAEEIQSISLREVPSTWVLARVTPQWTLDTVPPALLAEHEAGTWAELRVMHGSVEFIEPGSDFVSVAAPEQPVVIVPRRKHRITPSPDAVFAIAFFKEPAPEDFYTGLVAELYRHLRSETFDPAPYAAFIERSGQPALELGCGDGDPMLDLRSRGLDVEGVDSSADMLERFRKAAHKRDIDVTLHHATFQDMDLGKRYRTIFLAGATFNLLPNDATASAALERIAAHLHPEGSVLIPLFTPQAPVESDIGKVSEHTAEDGATMRVTVLDIVRDESTRDQFTELRYERIDGDEHQVADRSWQLHWFDQEAFAAMAADAGMVVRSVRGERGQPVTSHDTAITFILSHRPAE